MTQQLLTIGKIASQAEVNVQTVRYYERRQLLETAKRTEAGYRLYHPTIVKRIRFIKRAQELGFSLEEIQQLLDLKVQPESNCADVQEKADAKMKSIREKIQDLERLLFTLSELTAACQRREETAPCPIIEALEYDT